MIHNLKIRFSPQIPLYALKMYLFLLFLFHFSIEYYSLASNNSLKGEENYIVVLFDRSRLEDGPPSIHYFYILSVFILLN